MNVSPERHSSVSRPPNMNRASGPCVPLTAWASRSTAPLESPSAADAELAPRTMSGSVTLSSVSVHASAGSVARPATASGRRSHRSVRYRFMGTNPLSRSFVESRVVARASEADVQAERPIGRRGRRLEVAHHAGGAFEIVRLRVHARERGALPEVTGGDREARAGGPERPGPRRRQLVRRGGLSQPDKRRRLDEPPLRARRRLAQRDDPRLLPQRRIAVNETVAVQPRLAPDPLGAVELVVPTLVVEPPLDTQPLVEQVEPGDVDRFPARVRVPHELRAVLHSDLACRDDAVAVRVVEGVGPLPPSIDRIALSLPRRAAGDDS